MVERVGTGIAWLIEPLQIEYSMIWIDNLCSKLRSLLERGFLIKTVLVSSLVSLFLQVPSFPEIEALFPTRAILEISENPWQQIHYDVGSHAEKKTLRPLVPVIAGLLQFDETWQVYALFAFSNLLLLLLLAHFLKRETDDTLLAFLCTLGLSCAYFGFSGYGDTKGWGDVLPFVLILSSMVYPRPWVVVSTHFLAMTGDERAIVASALVVWWWIFRPQTGDSPSIWACVRGQMPLILAAFVALLAYIVLRSYMHLGLGFEAPMGNVGWQVLLEQNVETLLPGVWGAFEAFWLVWVFYVAALMVSGRYVEGSSLFLGTGAYVIACMMVHDVTRSLSYLFPLILLAIVHVCHAHPAKKELSRVFLMLSLFNIFAPTQYLYGKLRTYAPAFFRVIQFLR